jgi:hypothetical protein
MLNLTLSIALLLAPLANLRALDYPHRNAEPQKIPVRKGRSKKAGVDKDLSEVEKARLKNKEEEHLIS